MFLQKRLYIGQYGSTDSYLWNQKIKLSMSGMITTRPYFICQITFECLTLGAVVLFLISSCFIKRSRETVLPKGAIFGSLAAYFLSLVLLIPRLFFYLESVTVKQTYVVMEMLEEIFYYIAFLFLFYIFYRNIQNYLERFSNGSRAYAAVAIIHWVILGILSAISVAQCVMYIAILGLQVDEYYSLSRLILSYNGVAEARTIIFWVASVEILVWTTFIVARSRFNGKTGTIPFAVASFFFFVYGLYHTIELIRYDILLFNQPKYLDLATSIIEFVTTVGIYSGIIACCRQCSKSRTIDSQQQQAQMPYPGMPSYQPYNPVNHNPYPQTQFGYNPNGPVSPI